MSHRKRAGTAFGIGQTLVQHLHDRQAAVAADLIAQGIASIRLPYARDANRFLLRARLAEETSATNSGSVLGRYASQGNVGYLQRFINIALRVRERQEHVVARMHIDSALDCFRGKQCALCE